MLTQTDPANNTITYVYDKNSKEIKKIDQLGNEDSKTYYANGLQKTLTTNNGDIFTYTYDIHGRLINENVVQDNVTYEYDNNDNKTKIGNITRTYDNLNRILTSSENNQTVTYTYDDTLKTKTITDLKGNITVEEYDKANRLVKVINGDDITEYVYNPDGSMQKQINSKTKTIYEYYPDKKLKLLTTKDVNDILIEENYYEYDNNNNIIKDNNKIFTYDALNRIKTSNNIEYTYDTSGNILTKSLLTGNVLKVTGYSYNAKNQLLATTTLEGINVTSESSFTYDDNGNQLTETTNGNTTTNTYNARNELIEVNDGQTVAEYAYNAEGKRVQKVADSITTNFVYDGDNVILELDDQNNELAINIHGLSLLKRTTDKDGYYIYNGHGDVTKILDNTNNTLNTYEYDEFGKILSENETFNNPYKYAGYYYDKETKTYYLQARYYNPEIQRFISEDTYRGQLDDPLSLNLYTYVKNNPLIYVDPSGNIPVFNKLAQIAKNVISDTVLTINNTVKGISQGIENTMMLLSSTWENIELSQGKTLLTGRKLSQSEIYERQNDLAILYSITSAIGPYGIVVPPVVSRGLHKTSSIVSSTFSKAGKTISSGIDNASGFIINIFKKQSSTASSKSDDVSNVLKNILRSTDLDDATKIGNSLSDDTVKLLNKGDSKKYVNLASDSRTKHILYGDKTGGGHLWPAVNGKTAFPENWNSNRIMNEISDIVTDPKLVWNKGRVINGVQRYEVIDIRDGLKIKIVTDGKDIITAFPIK